MLFFILSLNAQHHIGVGGGYSQSIFYCGLPKSQYYTKFQPEDAFLLQATYKYDVPIKKENMRIGGQLSGKDKRLIFIMKTAAMEILFQVEFIIK